MIICSTCVGRCSTPSMRGTREAVDVGVDDTDGQALGGHRGGEVDGDARLADAALAGRDREDAGQASPAGRTGCRAVGLSPRSAVCSCLRCSSLITSSSTCDAGHTGDRADRGRDALGERVRIGQPLTSGRSPMRAVPSASTVRRLHHPDLGDGAADLGVLDGCEARPGAGRRWAASSSCVQPSCGPLSRDGVRRASPAR